MKGVGYVWMLVVALGAGSCYSRTSSAGSFVRDMEMTKRGLLVTTCKIGFETTRNLPLEIVTGARSSGTVYAGRCGSRLIDVGKEDEFVPPPARSNPDPEELLDTDEPVPRRPQSPADTDEPVPRRPQSPADTAVPASETTR